jgi:hypothetical protein
MLNCIEPVLYYGIKECMQMKEIEQVPIMMAENFYTSNSEKEKVFLTYLVICVYMFKLTDLLCSF